VAEGATLRFVASGRQVETVRPYGSYVRGMVPPVRSRAGRLRAWFLLAWITVGLLGAILLVAASKLVVRCDDTLREVPEPRGWRDWALADGPLPPPDATTPSNVPLCPAGSLSAAPWRRRATSESGAGRALWLRQSADTGTLVLASVPRDEEVPRESFVGAFQIQHATGYGFASSLALVCASALAGSAVLVFVGLALAYARLRSRPLPTDGRGRAPYRSTPPHPAPDEQDRGARTERAIRALRSALFAVLALLCMSVVVGAGVFFREVVRALL